MGYKRSEYNYEDNYWELEYYRLKEYYESQYEQSQLEDARKEIERLEKNYEYACVLLNSGEFYTKLVAGWKEEKQQLQNMIDELKDGIHG